MASPITKTVPASTTSSLLLHFSMEEAIRSITLTLQQEGQIVDLSGQHQDGSEGVNPAGKVDAKATIAVTKDGQTVDYPGENWKAVWTAKPPKDSGLKGSGWLLSSKASAAKYGAGMLVFKINRTDAASSDAWEITVPVPPGDWGPSYLVNGKVAKLRSGKSYEEWWTSIPATVPTSVATSKPTAAAIDQATLLKIFPAIATDLAAYQTKKAANKLGTNDLDVEAVVAQIVKNLNDAFRIMAIDTKSAYSAYLANAFIESDQFRFMTESALKTGGNRPYEPEPSNVKLDEHFLNQAKTGTVNLPGGKTLKVTGYQKGGEVNPLDNGWENSFLGRGPIQVTNRSGYLQTIAILEHRWTELQDDADKKAVADTLVAIKAAPLQAANPICCYLFSAAFMKAFKGDVSGKNFTWMGQQIRGAEKEQAYSRILSLLP
jgi:hypothetical protein